jgi:esterase
MGGKTAMELALGESSRVDRLIVADIAPVDYSPRHDTLIDALLALDLSVLKSRTDADQELSATIQEKPVRQFLLKNLTRNGNGFRWRINLEAIARCYSNIAAAPQAAGPFHGPTLFLKGAQSEYIQDQHRDAVSQLFPNASLRIISGTGHWLHAEKPDIFANLCQRFLSGSLDQT